MADDGVPFSIPGRYVYTGTRLEGGQGYVYIYLDTFLDRHVAIKVMKDLSHSDILREELSLIREIQSRHIAEIYDLVTSTTDNSIALVEEYVPGLTLDQISTSGEMIDVGYATKLLWQVASGIADIHIKGVVHRDIKPNNIKKDAEGLIKILDFGISSDLSEHPDTILARGTPGYLAPELYNRAPIALTQEMDVYAFGVTAWHLLNCGRCPRQLSETPPQSTGRAPSIQSAALVLPKRLVDIIDSSLSPDPAGRPTMARIRDMLFSDITSGMHRLVLSHEGRQEILNSSRRKVTLTVGTSSLTINYTDLDFAATDIAGSVYINNTKITSGGNLPESGVITFGDGGSRGRAFVPISIHSPEVVL